MQSTLELRADTYAAIYQFNWDAQELKNEEARGIRCWRGRRKSRRRGRRLEAVGEARRTWRGGSGGDA
ncbi:hypothetical protein Ahy_A05g021694 isoform E [Arachis hypogaea]|uniref:Uncharacterized protein n=1 Tax=Arachis hypogaea TaxID=3818 RepID=A0A445CY88_ARAHY|nr:hypothetical protein Ahy_A05g021694 isoform E [Arachis hypogaea]